jgi:hypothetical protein
MLVTLILLEVGLFGRQYTVDRTHRMFMNSLRDESRALGGAAGDEEISMTGGTAMAVQRESHYM